MSTDGLQGQGFDFDTHRRDAEAAYQRVRPLYQDFCEAVGDVIRESLTSRGIKVASIETRAKTVESYGTKVATPAHDNPQRPRYERPLEQITDLAAVRIITFFPKTVEEVGDLIQSEFQVLEKSDKAVLLEQEDRFGYMSIHYLIRLGPNRTPLAEYKKYKDLTAEIQIRTILQHAWAEIEHDIQYKSLETAPQVIRRRFMSLAGLFEIADREFQAIQDEDEQLRQQARESVQQGKLDEVEITPDALKQYLDDKLGVDRRIAASWYQQMAEDLRHMGFRNFQQIDECIHDYDQDVLSRVVWEFRQGQNWRFITLLMAGMGSNWPNVFPRSTEENWARIWTQVNTKLQSASISLGNYVPS